MTNSILSMMAAGPNSPAIEGLSVFCSAELGATITYERALSVPALAPHAVVLRRCYARHHECALELAERIVALGGEPPLSPSTWGSLLPMLTLASAVITPKVAIGLLEESENRGLYRYREEAPKLDPATRDFLLERIVPAQNACHAAVDELRRTAQF